MPRLEYETKSFRARTLAVIEQANEIIAEYQGYALTLRQLYYQFVARGLIENSKREYERLGRTISDARLAGLIDWSAIEDRTRSLRQRACWDSPQGAIAAVADQYHIDLWKSQKVRPEVWIEKAALIGVIEDVCSELAVARFVMGEAAMPEAALMAGSA